MPSLSLLVLTAEPKVQRVDLDTVQHEAARFIFKFPQGCALCSYLLSVFSSLSSLTCQSMLCRKISLLSELTNAVNRQQCPLKKSVALLYRPAEVNPELSVSWRLECVYRFPIT